MKSKTCDKNVIKLYSSVNFSNPADSKEIQNWDNKLKLKALVHFVGEYNNGDQPSVYFKATISFDACVNKLGQVTKKNILVKDVCFKNELNVSGSSLTDEYKYLYDISCSSADNASTSQCSSSDSDLSLSDIVANGIEKDIVLNLKSFMESDAFQITWTLDVGTVTLDTTKYNNGETFPNVKMTIKYKLVCKAEPNKFVKLILLGFVALLVIMLLRNIFKKNDNGVLDKFSDLFKKNNEEPQNDEPQNEESQNEESQNEE
jgi:hypothetical protein